MAHNPQLLGLLEELLDSAKSPEEVCRDYPELLPQVQQRWEEFQVIDAQLKTLLPGLDTLSDVATAPSRDSNPEPPAAFGRYEVRRPLGSGGFGAVYLGHDTQLDRAVAVKVLHSRPALGAIEDARALQEARRLARLRHPGIVAVHDVGVQNGQLYIVADYINGVDLGQWLREKRPGWREAVAVAAAVADALSHAHARLIIHRDVKPGNILLPADGSPVLVDFGLALDDAGAGGVAKGIVAGTPWYMSPEQAAGAAHRIDGRTDIYSLGVVLYEMLTGRTPFRAVAIPELLRQVRDDEPQPPRQLVGDLPVELERICLKAMAKRQSDRYSTAADFAADLRRALPTASRGEWTSTRSDWHAGSTTSSSTRHTVGRREELIELDRAFELSAAGQGRFLCVTGEPGIGKTTLIEDFLSELSATNRRIAVARGRCSERLAGTEAYLPILEALESLLRGEEGEAIAELMKATAPNWYEQVAPLASKDSSLIRALAESRAASQERLKRELCSFLQEASQMRPLVVFIDDLHWADASTVDLLAYLGGKCDGMRVFFLFTYRPTDLLLSKHPFGPIKLDLQSRGVCREMALEFLSPQDLDRYLSLEFPGHDFPADFAALIQAKTEGSPLFMADLLRYLRDQQVLSQEQGHWTLRKSVPDLRQELPESVRGMIQRKLEQLNEDDRRLLVAASVQGYEFDSAVVAGALDQDPAEVEDRLNELDRVHAFVRVVMEQELPDRTLTVRYRFVHVLYQNVLYASLQPTRRASLSAAVAQTLRRHYGEQSATVAADLALLLEAARDYMSAADYFLIAAQSAARIFANQEAVVLARRGVDVLMLAPDNPERARKELALQIALGPALFATKDWTDPDVEAAYLRANALCEELGDSPDLFPALWGLFLFRIACGEMRTGLDLGQQLLSLAERADDSAMFLQAHHALGPIYVFLGNWALAKTHLKEGIARYDRRQHRTQAFSYGGHDPCVCCLGYAAKAQWMLGYPDQALQSGQQALTLARELGHPTSLAHTQLSVAILHQYRRDVAKTLELAEELLTLATDQGLVFYLAGASVLKGWALVALGRHAEGMAQIQQGFGTGGATLAHWRTYFLTLMAEAYGQGGDFQNGLALLKEGAALVESSDIRLYEPEIYRIHGEFLLSLDAANAAEAEDFLNQAVEAARRHHAKSLELRATMSLARLRQRQGRGGEGRDALAAIYRTYAEGLSTPDLLDAAAQLNGLG